MEVGRPLGPYDIVESLGRGGTASVWRALERDTGRVVALKVLGTRVDPTTVRRFRGEAEILSALDHPNIVKIYGAAEYDGLLVCALQYVAGSSLDRLIEAAGREGRTVPVPRAVSVVADLLSAIHYLEQLALCHRDIKPANVLVDGEGHALLADFGMARFRYRSHLTQDGYVLGTLRYMSPEQIRGEEVDHRSDLYQVGLVLYELLAGGLPFADRNPYSQARLRCQGELPAPDLSLPRGGDALAALLRRACARDPLDRYQRARDMLAELHQAVRPLDTDVHQRELIQPARQLTEQTKVLLSRDFRAPTPPVAGSAAAARPRRAAARKVAAALAGLSLVAAVGWFAFWPGGDPLAAVERELAAGRVQGAALQLVAALDRERAEARRAGLERRRRAELAARVARALPDGQGGLTLRGLLEEHEASWRREATELLGELDRRRAASGATAATSSPPSPRAGAAFDLIRLGLTNPALEALREALRGAPDDPALLREALRRSVALRRAGTLDLLGRLRKLDPTGTPELASFEAFFRANRADDGAAQLAAALDMVRLAPDEPLGPAMAAPSLAAAGRHAEAEAMVRRGLALMPDNPELQLLHARYLQRDGKLKEASDAAVAAFLGDPVDTPFLVAVLQLADASGRWSEVAQRLSAVRPVFLGEAGLAFVLVHVLAHLGSYEEALAVLDEHFAVDKRTTLRYRIRAEQGGEVAGLAQNLEQLSFVTFQPQRLAALCALGRWEEVPRLVERILGGPPGDGPLAPEVLLWRSNGLNVAHEALGAALVAAQAGQAERPVELHLYWGMTTRTPFVARPCPGDLAGLAPGLLERLARLRDETDAALRAAGQAPPGR